MPKCMMMSTVSKNSLIAWKVDFFFFACAANCIKTLRCCGKSKPHRKI